MKRRRKYTKGNKWIRKALNELARDIYEYTIALPSKGWDMTPSGLRDRRKDGTGYTPHFSPVFTPGSSPTLGITWGWLNGPKAVDTDHEIPDYDLYPFMPEINLVALNHASPNVLSLTKSATNLTYLEVALVKRTATIGETDLDGTRTGLTVWTELQNTQDSYDPEGTPTNLNITLTDSPSGDTISETAHKHRAMMEMNQLAYHIASTAPQFKVTTAAVVPKNTETTRYIPCGKHVLDSNGETTSTPEWYWLGDRDFTPNSWVQGGTSTGHVIYDTDPDENADDTSINPAIA